MAYLTLMAKTKVNVTEFHVLHSGSAQKTWGVNMAVSGLLVAADHSHVQREWRPVVYREFSLFTVEQESLLVSRLLRTYFGSWSCRIDPLTIHKACTIVATNYK